ncbi:MAG: hypothetical protein ACUVTM_07295 [Candidatus Bathyarchaeia archaeon]
MADAHTLLLWTSETVQFEAVPNVASGGVAGGYCRCIGGGICPVGDKRMDIEADNPTNVDIFYLFFAKPSAKEGPYTLFHKRQRAVGNFKNEHT